MRWTRDRQKELQLLERVKEEYLSERPDLHLSELLDCLTRSYWNRTEPLEPTDREVLLWAIGFGLERVWLRGPDTLLRELKTVDDAHLGDPYGLHSAILAFMAEHAPVASERVDGIYMTPDFIALEGWGLDLKSTRMRAQDSGEPTMGWPEGWLEQFMAYARMRGTDEWSVAVLYLGAPDLVVGTMEFEQEEMERNWEYVIARRDVYINAVAQGVVPEPFQWNKEFMCRDCKYRMRCESIAGRKAPATR